MRPGKRAVAFCIALSAVAGPPTSVGRAQNVETPLLKTATHHAMQYYLSLPSGWSAEKSWPVVIALDGSGKTFVDLARAYASARGDQPFIVVAPLILTNGGVDLRSLPNYRYASAVWDEVDRTGRCQFDLEGLDAVIDDVQSLYNGRRGIFLAGFSAGGHLTWAMVLHQPEKLAAAAISAGNYAGRCIDEDKISTNPARVSLQVREFLGDQDPGRQGFDAQFNSARRLAEQHGYAGISLSIVSGKHEPLQAQVLTYFGALIK
jgi:poly(3-hydroxybutyrate) depolymerase